MELRTVDPRTLAFNPDNPRRIKASAALDEQLATSIAELGLFTPPLVRESEGGLTIVAGERRVRAVLSLDWTEMRVLVDDGTPERDAARSISENVIRAGMNEVDQWRSITALLDNGWTEGSICSVFGLTERMLGQLQLLARILPAILDWIAAGKGPSLKERGIIANASLEDQAAVRKKLKPKKGDEPRWWEISRALRKDRIPFETAAFDDATAERFGITWIRDLFAPADSDGRFTENVEAFVFAQTEWMETHLPKNGEVITLNQYGQTQLPKKAERIWGRPLKTDRIGVYLDRQSYAIEQVAFRMPASKPKGANANTDTVDGTDGVHLPKKARAPISAKGVDMIGQYRTDALREAVIEQAGVADPWQLVGTLVLALAAKNVRVEGKWRDQRQAIAGGLIVDGLLIGDVTILRHATGAILAEVVNADSGPKGSGPVALVVGASFGAGGKLPNMAHEDFLKTLSKDAITEELRAQRIAPRNTGKEMRAALIRHVGEGVYHHPSARFELTDAEKQAVTFWGKPVDGEF